MHITREEKFSIYVFDKEAGAAIQRKEMIGGLGGGGGGVGGSDNRPDSGYI